MATCLAISSSTAVVGSRCLTASRLAQYVATKRSISSTRALARRLPEYPLPVSTVLYRIEDILLLKRRACLRRCTWGTLDNTHTQKKKKKRKASSPCLSRPSSPALEVGFGNPVSLCHHVHHTARATRTHAHKLSMVFRNTKHVRTRTSPPNDSHDSSMVFQIGSDASRSDIGFRYPTTPTHAHVFYLGGRLTLYGYLFTWAYPHSPIEGLSTTNPWADGSESCTV